MTVSLSTAESRALRTAAKASGMSAEDYLRYKATGIAPVN